MKNSLFKYNKIFFGQNRICILSTSKYFDSYGKEIKQTLEKIDPSLEFYGTGLSENE